MNAAAYFTVPDQTSTSFDNVGSDNDQIHKLLGTRFDENGKVSDKKIIDLIKSREKDYESLHEKIKRTSEKNREYYKGNQLDPSKLLEKESPSVVNRILTAVEAIIPIVTENTPQSIITITPRNNNTYNLRTKIENKLSNLWEIENQMQTKNEIGLRLLFAQGFYPLKIFYNDIIDDIDCYVIPMNQIAFPEHVSSVDEASGIIEYIKSTVGKLKAKFPDKAEEIFNTIKSKNPNVSDSSPITYTEYWEDDWYACKYEDLLLSYNINPNYLLKGLNYFKEPKKPYIWLNYLTYGDELVDDTTLIGQGIPLQNSINRRKRQIELNADMQNGTTVIAGAILSEAQGQEIQNDPQATIYLPGVEDVNGKVVRITGVAMPQTTFDDMQDSKEEIDNVMGTHSTTRGEQGHEETALGRQILISRDVGRLGTLFRRIEKFGQEYYEYCLQLMYVFYDENHPVLAYEKDKNGQNQKLNNKTVEDFINNSEFENVDIRILVQQGSATPTDKTNRQANAVDLTKAGMMALIDMYKTLEYENPEQLAKNAIMQKIDPFFLFPEIKNPDEYDISAIMDIKKITDAPLDEVVHIEHKVNSLKLMQNYLNTLADYKKGMEVDPDLPPYDTIDVPAKISLEDLMQQVYMDLNTMVQQAQEQMVQQQAPAQGAPIDPQQMQTIVQAVKESILQELGAAKQKKDLYGQILGTPEIGQPVQPPQAVVNTSSDSDQAMQ